MTTEKQNKSNVIHPFQANVFFLQPLKAKITHIKIQNTTSTGADNNTSIISVSLFPRK